MTRSRTAVLAVATAAVLTVLPSGAGAVGSAAGTVPAASVEDPAADRRTTWTIGPAGADGPDSRTSIRHAVDPGETVTDHVAVTNFGPDPATFRVYAGDGVVGDDGAFDIRPRGSEPTDGGRWVTVADAPGASRDADGSLTVALEPETTVVVPVTIAVPQEATPGDHPAGAVAEIVPAGALPVEVSTRVGVRVHLRVTGEIEAGVVARDVRTDWQPSPNPSPPARW
ncbi:hypothetical protein [Cellulomonas sp. ATA003]|uniref:hypothetical protein n=1 Tax=Cellulomonas sp. ATA003 TaxID=3073064 RepID=UPI0028738FB8|nr:hypothetical protein [Cellulomonas sp. ATA003]WNB84568.1 hypothetical protein REH70_12110 [Cellulomonas sp. ATA003]